jgi:pimeloyl-ACP methyl ester carboxylesterase
VHWEQSAYLYEHIPGCRRKVIEGASHGYFWQLPEVSAEALLEWTAANPA